jgi:hypothetical protein
LKYASKPIEENGPYREIVERIDLRSVVQKPIDVKELWSTISSNDPTHFSKLKEGRSA